MDRYVIDAPHPTDQLVVDGIDWLYREAFVNGLDGAVLVPQAQNIPALSGGVGRTLSSTDRTFFRDGLDIQILTARDHPSVFAGPLLVVWANSAMMASAEHLAPPAICATSWEHGGLVDWVRVWGATDPRTNEHRAAEPVPRVITGAIRSMGFDVLHPLDKRRAVDALKALRLCERKIDPAMIRAEAGRHDWPPRAADRLYELAQKMAQGKVVQGGSKLTKTKAKRLRAACLPARRCCRGPAHRASPDSTSPRALLRIIVSGQGSQVPCRVPVAAWRWSQREARMPMMMRAAPIHHAFPPTMMTRMPAGTR